MNIGIIGSRRRDSREDLIKTALVVDDLIEKYSDHGPVFKIVSGGCPKGGDRFAEIIAERLYIPTIIHPADWSQYGRGAGFIRNTDIARDSDILIACVSEDRKGGTEDTIKKFLKKLAMTEEMAILAEWLILV
jgi:hypothetical protein